LQQLELSHETSFEPFRAARIMAYAHPVTDVKVLEPVKFNARNAVIGGMSNI
jgi:hypothetical protein